MAEHESHKINLLIITPYEDFYEGMVDSVRIPTSDGEFGFVAGHTPFVAALEPGICSITCGKEVKHCVLSEGYCEISGMLALIICNSAEWPEDLRIRRMINAYKQALEEIKTHKNKEGRQVFTEDSIAKGKRALARMQFIEKYGSEELKTNKNKEGRQVFPEDSIAKGKRALARMRFIEKYGSDQQKERIASLKKSEFPNGVLPRLQ